MEAYNVQPAEVDIYVYAGDTIDMDFEVDLNGEDESLTGSELTGKIKKMDGSILRDLPADALPIDDDSFSLVTEPIATVGIYKYDIIRTEEEVVNILMKGKFHVMERQTPGE